MIYIQNSLKGAIKSMGPIMIPLLLALVFAASLSNSLDARTLVFQSGFEKPGPTPVPNWIGTLGGGIREFGAVTVEFPAGFVQQEQGGAQVFGDVLIDPLLIKDLSTYRLVAGTEFTLGVWTPNYDLDDQQRYHVNFQQPIEIRVNLDAAQLSSWANSQLMIMAYDPITDEWVPLPSELNKATFQIRAPVHSFQTLPKDYPIWGGRGFFGVFARVSGPQSTAAVVVTATLGQNGEGSPISTAYPTYTPYPTYTLFPTFTPSLTPYPTSTPYPTYTPFPSQPSTAQPNRICAPAFGTIVVLLLLLMFRRS